MCALLHHHPVLDHRYTVCILDGGQPVGYNDARTALARLVQSILNNLHTGQTEVINEDKCRLITLLQVRRFFCEHGCKLKYVCLNR